MIEKGKTSITDVKYDFLNVVIGKMKEDLLYVKGALIQSSKSPQTFKFV